MAQFVAVRRANLLVGLMALACGGHTDGGSSAEAGESSPDARWASMVDQLCSQMLRLECNPREDHVACVSVFVSERETAAQHGCTQTYDELTECLFEHGMYCNPYGLAVWRSGCEALGREVEACVDGP